MAEALRGLLWLLLSGEYEARTCANPYGVAEVKAGLVALGRAEGRAPGSYGEAATMRPSAETRESWARIRLFT